MKLINVTTKRVASMDESLKWIDHYETTCSSLSSFVLQFSKAMTGFSIAVQLVTIATCSMYMLEYNCTLS